MGRISLIRELKVQGAPEPLTCPSFPSSCVAVFQPLTLWLEGGSWLYQSGDAETGVNGSEDLSVRVVCPFPMDLSHSPFVQC